MRNAGVFTAAEAAQAGLSDDAVLRGIEAGKWRRLLPRTYAFSGHADDWRQMAVAACSWADPAWLSHRAAGRVWQLDGVTAGGIEITTARNVRSRKVTVHRASLDPIDVTRRSGLRVTDPTRTLLDLAALGDRQRLEQALHCALRRGLTSVARLEQRLERLGGKGRSGTTILRAVIADAPRGRPMESPLEVDLLSLLRRNGLPDPSVQYEVEIEGRRFRFDFAYPAARLAIEVDGHEFHSTKQAWRVDRMRQNAVVSADWKVLRYTKADLCERPNEVVKTISGFIHPELL